PRTVAAAAPPERVVSDIDRLHVTGAGVHVVRLGVSVIEAASAVIVRPARYHVLPLRSVAGRDAGRGISPITYARGHEDAVHGVPFHGHLERRCDRLRIGSLDRAAGR